MAEAKNKMLEARWDDRFEKGSHKDKKGKLPYGMYFIKICFTDENGAYKHGAEVKMEAPDDLDAEVQVRTLDTRENLKSTEWYHTFCYKPTKHGTKVLKFTCEGETKEMTVEVLKDKDE